MSVSSTTYLQLQSRYTDVQTNKQTQPQGVLRTTPAPDQVRRRRARLERQVVKGREQAVGQQELDRVQHYATDCNCNGKKPAGKTMPRWPAPLANPPQKTLKRAKRYLKVSALDIRLGRRQHRIRLFDVRSQKTILITIASSLISIAGR